MSETYVNDGLCQETSGFLFSHRCDRTACDRCSRCQKPLCSDHAHETAEGVLCTTCLKQQAKAARQQDPTGTRTIYHDHYYHDPYFYGPRYYPGYGAYYSSSHPSHSSFDSFSDSSGGDFAPSHDPADFTEGDAANLQREEDADFETDMGAS
jgi:hypothetical protein